MIRRVIKKVNGKRYVINIPVVDFDNENSFDFGGGGPTSGNVNVVSVIVEILRITEDNNIRITENGLNRILE